MLQQAKMPGSPEPHEKWPKGAEDRKHTACRVETPGTCAGQTEPALSDLKAPGDTQALKDVIESRHERLEALRQAHSRLKQYEFLRTSRRDFRCSRPTLPKVLLSSVGIGVVAGLVSMAISANSDVSVLAASVAFGICIAGAGIKAAREAWHMTHKRDVKYYCNKVLIPATDPRLDDEQQSKLVHAGRASLKQAEETLVKHIAELEARLSRFQACAVPAASHPSRKQPPKQKDETTSLKARQIREELYKRALRDMDTIR